MLRLTAQRARARFKKQKRNASGAMSMIALATSTVVIMLGAISFDIFLAREQYNQLQAASDAAALSAAEYLTQQTNLDLELMQKIGLQYFKKNHLTSGSLSTATLSPSALTDTPNSGDSTLNVVADKKTNIVTATTSFGLQPTLLKFLGTFPIHTTSIAGPAQTLKGDVCLVLDLSDSMGYSNYEVSPPPYPRFKRTFHSASKVTTYSLQANGGRTAYLPGSPGSEFIHPAAVVLDPASITFPPPPDSKSGDPLYMPNLSGQSSALSINPYETPQLYANLSNYANALANPPSGWSVPKDPITGNPFTVEDVKTALLCEASLGNLENQAVYAPANASKAPSASTSVLQYLPPTAQNTSGGFQPQAGLQAEYQRLALTKVQFRATECTAIYNFVHTLAAEGRDIHWSLVGFGPRAGGTPQALARGAYCSTFDPAHVDKFMWPASTLDQSNNNARQIIDYVALGTLSDGTNTPAALKAGIEQLTGPGHRQGLPKTLILLTDGMPTEPGSLQPSLTSQFGQNGIQLIILGFFGCNYAWPEGNTFCKELQVKVGNGAQYYPIRAQNGYNTPLTPSEQATLFAILNNALQDIATKPIGGTVCLQQGGAN